MQIQINGQKKLLPVSESLESLLKEETINAKTPGIAVAVNGCVISRGNWPYTVLKEGDRVEIVHAVYGG